MTYNGDLASWQRVEKQLSRIELSNKFSHTVFFDNDHQFQEGSKEEQEFATAYNVLIQNAIILWNYLYLSQLLAATTHKERNETVASIKHGSVISWRYVNLKGEYNFMRAAANDSLFDYNKILSLRIVT